jgi:serine/threonine protein kinase
MFDSIRLSDLPEQQCVTMRKPSNTRPTIWLVEENGVRAIVKDFSALGFRFRNTVGRFLVWREAKAYRKMKNIKGVPTLYRVIGGLALVIEEIPGKDLKKLKKEMRLPDEFFDALKDLVDRFHKRGLAHCDLKKPPNILMGHDGLPYVIDWGAAVFESELRFPPLNLIYRRFLLDDYMAVVKQRLRHTPETVTPEERRLYNHKSGAERVIRAVRDRLKDILQKLA